MEKLTFVQACNRYFGRKEGQSLTDFQQELKQLTEKDRKDLVAMFPTVGIEIIPA